MWPEVKQVKTENRFELVLSGDEITKRLEKEGQLDNELFELLQLNFLRITRTCLTTLPDNLAKLSNLTNLVLQTNKLTSLPDSICLLAKLKLLDVSLNELENIPADIGKLSSLVTLNASQNNLSSLPSFKRCLNLAHLDLSKNQLTDFPDICLQELVLIADVNLSGNEIKELPADVKLLSSLKVLDMQENKVKVVPGEITSCPKIKELYLKGNPLEDNRFRKLVENGRTKPSQVLDYISQHCHSAGKESGKGGKGKGKKGKKGSNRDQEMDDVDEICDILKVLNVAEVVPTVQVTPAIKEVRPYIVCCVVCDFDLAGEKFRSFINIQTKLHDTVCEKRRGATIATHDFSKIQGPLTFDAQVPEVVMIHPLTRGKEVSARELYESLKEEAEKQRKMQKRNTISGIQKYLELVDKWEAWPCLIDVSGKVVSLPPITNSELTKISAETKDLFIEITSSASLAKAKQVADALLMAMLEMKKQGSGSKAELTVKQVRAVEMDGTLRTVYPSRTDFSDMQGLKIIWE